MDVPSSELQTESRTDTQPLLMERAENISINEHVIQMPRRTDGLELMSHDRISNGLEALSSTEDRLPISRAPIVQPSTTSSIGSNSRSSVFARREEGSRRGSPLNSCLWISVELILTVSQIVASIIVLSVSRNEHPHAPLFAWIVGYASGCFATLPLLYWRYRHRNQVLEQDSAQNGQASTSTHINIPPTGLFSISVSRNSEVQDRQTTATSPRGGRGGQNAGAVHARLKVLMEYFKMIMDCFFAVWFVVGNVWIFGGHTSAGEAPNMYRLCIVFLSFSCIGYAMPFILCTTLCCCLPCIISVLGFREDLSQTRGATPESIEALPTYKFKLNKKRNNGDGNSEGNGDGSGVMAAGTEKERAISGEDAACCICLAKYANNDELKELPCSHFFHKDCVDKWLKINASCPLCKSEVGESSAEPVSHSNSGRQRHENGVGNSTAITIF